MAGDDQSILLRLEAEGKSAPRVRLRADGTEAPALRQTGRFEILGELAQGGVGQVLKGRDVDLGRDVALKVLRTDHAGNAEIVQRFVDEAQIGGQLQHPGVVPVYELGLQKDERPFFAMKLVKGKTLAALLKERADPGRGRRRLLQVFEQVCQTLAYAHARGVIHRDLKPANVMVGAFGEVQVLDWGFAKVLPRGGIADERRPRELDVTRIATLRSQGAGSESIVGSVMGTPAYMPPEQALGEVELMDERSDVFSLGAILCEILTGGPPYEGDDALIRAAQARLDDALRRLDQCGADPQLVALAKSSLAPLRTERPRDARALAEATHVHLAAVEERAHRSAVAAAKARAKADKARAAAREQRRARRQSVLAGAAVVLAVLIGGTSYLWIGHSRRAHARRTALAVTHAMTEAQRLSGEERWGEALTAAEQAAQLARADDVDAQTRQRARALHATIARDEKDAREKADKKARDDSFLARIEEIRLRRGEAYDDAETDAAYTAAFRDHGLDVATPDPKEVGALLRERFPSIAIDLAAALDDWARLRRTALPGRDWKRLIGIARHADPDEWRDRLRDAVTAADLERLRALAGEALEKGLSVRLLDQLGCALEESGDADAAATFLRRAQRAHPDDLWINYHAALFAMSSHPPRPEDAVRFATAALAARPGSWAVWNVLGGAHMASGECDDAIRADRTAIRLCPDRAGYHSNLSCALKRKGLLDEAIAAARKALELDPTLRNAYTNLGEALREKGLVEEAIATAREALRLDADWPGTHVSLGLALASAGEFEAAVAALEEGVRLDPRNAHAHNDLGAIRANGLGDTEGALACFREALRLDPTFAEAYYNLGNVLLKKGRPDEALDAYREAVRLQPDNAKAHSNLAVRLDAKGLLEPALAEYREAVRLDPQLGVIHLNLAQALHRKGLLEEAIDAYREAIRLDPGRASAHVNLGSALSQKGHVAEAIAVFREGLRLDPGLTDAHFGLGMALATTGRWDEAIAPFREVIRLAPGNAAAHNNLGAALRQSGHVDEAIRMVREAIRLAPGYADAHLNLGNALKQKGLLDEAIAAYRNGIQLNPGRALAHRLLGDALAEARRLREAISAYGTALRIQPDEVATLYNAACAAALAAAGEGDSAGAGAVERAWWRGDALAWLRTTLQLARKQLAANPAGVRQFLEHAQGDPDLASVRDALDQLPEDERAAWRELWAEVAEVLGDE